MRTNMKIAAAAGPALAVLLGVGSMASAVPLSSRPTGPGIHYFGYFASAFEGVGDPMDGCPSGDYTGCVADHANITSIAASTPAETARRLAEAQQLGMGAIVDAGSIFFIGGANTQPNCTNWKSAWDAFASAIKPYANTIVGFYLVDEPPAGTMNGICAKPGGDGKNIIADEVSAISHDFPSAHKMLVFEARLTLDDDSWTIPNGVDWVGYDCYPGTFGQCYDASPGWKSVPYYLGRLKSIIRKSNLAYKPGLVLLPQGYLGAADGSPTNQSALLARVEREVSMVENDPDFVMIMPFTWQGVGALPMARSYYTGLGKHLTTTTMPMRPAFPTATAASNVTPGGDLVNAFDGNDATAWNSGGYQPQWISASFADPLVISNFSLTAEQSPAGLVRHIFSGKRLDGTSTTLDQYTGQLADDQTLSSGAAAPAGGLSSLTITTDISPSWVAWREFALRTTGTTRVYGYSIGPSDGTGSNRAQNAYDGDPSTVWIPPASAPPAAAPSLTLDLGQVQTLSRIEVIVYRNGTSGTETHSISAGPTTGNLTLRGSATTTTDGQKLAFVGPFTNVRYVKISAPATTFSIGWREINLYR